ncbi:MAG: DUF5690 family protein [Akkermansiaceae bacterium]
MKSEKSSTLSFTPWTIAAVVAAFATYYCMYSFRKPFTVLAFDGAWGAFELKTAIVTSQLIGYVTAKFLGTHFCSGLRRDRVFYALMGCILAALGSLALLAVLPAKLGVIAMALNGLSLGMVWGMVMRPLEGRGSSEFLLAGLCCSFIIASGDVKTTGKRVLESDLFHNIFGSELWMPFATCLLYLIPFTIAAFILSKVPKPSLAEEATRSARNRMTWQDRTAFIKNLLGILIPLAITYFMLTAFRDYRDNFQADLFEEVGVDISSKKGIFSTTERIIAFSVVGVTALVILIKRHLSALQTSHVVMALSLTLPTIAIILRKSETIDGMTWMVLNGIGAYIPYILIHCVTFERLVSLTKSPGNAVFAMMLFDGLGYIGPIIMIPLGDFIGGDSRLETFDSLTYALSAVGVLSMIACYIIAPRYKKDDNVS